MDLSRFDRAMDEVYPRTRETAADSADAWLRGTQRDAQRFIERPLAVDRRGERHGASRLSTAADRAQQPSAPRVERPG